VEDEAAKCAYGESLAEGKHISVSKICQGGLSALGVSAFGILGFQMQEQVPGFCNLALIKGKVCNSSIHLSAICNKPLLCFSNLFSFGQS
jgi:hypothetical protein